MKDVTLSLPGATQMEGMQGPHLFFISLVIREVITLSLFPDICSHLPGLIHDTSVRLAVIMGFAEGKAVCLRSTAVVNLLS